MLDIHDWLLQIFKCDFLLQFNSIQFQKCNISSIFKKGKIVRNNFDNYRGVFRTTIFRSILDRLIFNDYYGKIDDFITDCNVGGRKGRNIRDNLFVLNAITNHVKKGGGEACDISAYDIVNVSTQCGPKSP